MTRETSPSLENSVVFPRSLIVMRGHDCDCASEKDIKANNKMSGYVRLGSIFACVILEVLLTSHPRIPYTRVIDLGRWILLKPAGTGTGTGTGTETETGTRTETRKYESKHNNIIIKFPFLSGYCYKTAKLDSCLPVCSCSIARLCTCAQRCLCHTHWVTCACSNKTCYIDDLYRQFLTVTIRSSQWQVLKLVHIMHTGVCSLWWKLGTIKR